MGFSGNNPQRAPLKPVYTKPIREEKDDLRIMNINGDHDDDSYSSIDDVADEEESGDSVCTTPTAEESRIVSSLGRTCPPAPRKRKATSKCSYSREFFTPPDLESVFLMRHVQRA